MNKTDFETAKDRVREQLTKFTVKAFQMLPRMDKPRILDVGCGSGVPTRKLAELSNGHITAIDIDQEAINRLQQKITESGLSHRIKAFKQSMLDMDFPEESFDLIWSEGALYIMGFENALKVCQRLLKPGGYLAASELSWLTDDAPREAREFFSHEYPEMKTVEDNAQLFSDCGYELLGHFTEPDRVWWDEYYTPMQRLLPGLRLKYAAVPDALALFDECDAEMAVHEKHAASYGYEFFVARRVD